MRLGLKRDEVRLDGYTPEWGNEFDRAAAATSVEGEMLIDNLEVGGLLLMDDFTPEEHWPDQWRGKTDPVRELWLNHENFIVTEIYLTSTSSAILATKIK